MEWISKYLSCITVQNLDGLTFDWSIIKLEKLIKWRVSQVFFFQHWFLDPCLRIWLWSPEQLVTDFSDMTQEIYKEQLWVKLAFKGV